MRRACHKRLLVNAKYQCNKGHARLLSIPVVVSLGAYSGTFKATGKAMTAPFAHAWIVRGDRISRFIQYTDTIKIREAMS
jgi:hypothetical protein